jgi:hypothetical protein
MPGRIGKFSSALSITIFISTPFTTVARGEPAAAEECLLTPGSGAPAGSHWRYHTDHVNKRNCWFLRKDGDALSQTLPKNSATAASQPSPPPAKPSVADARAEYRPQDNALTSPSANPANSPTSAAGSETRPAAAPAWNSAAAVSTRWPDVPAASPAPSAAPPAPLSSADVSATTEDAAPPSTDPAQAIIPSIPFIQLSLPAQLSSVRPETILTLVAAVLAALAFAGAAALITRRNRRRLRRRVVPSARGQLWETTDDDRIILSDQPYPDVRDYRPRFARGVASAAAAQHRAREFARRAPRQASR